MKINKYRLRKQRQRRKKLNQTIRKCLLYEDVCYRCDPDSGKEYRHIIVNGTELEKHYRGKLIDHRLSMVYPIVILRSNPRTRGLYVFYDRFITVDHAMKAVRKLAPANQLVMSSFEAFQAMQEEIY